MKEDDRVRRKPSQNGHEADDFHTDVGIQDALALRNALHAVLSGARDAAALEEYEQSRRPIAQRVVELTDRMTRFATIPGRRKRALRNFVIRILNHIPAFRQSLAMELAEL